MSQDNLDYNLKYASIKTGIDIKDIEQNLHTVLSTTNNPDQLLNYFTINNFYYANKVAELLHKYLIILNEKYKYISTDVVVGMLRNFISEDYR